MCAKTGYSKCHVCEEVFAVERSEYRGISELCLCSYILKIVSCFMHLKLTMQTRCLREHVTSSRNSHTRCRRRPTSVCVFCKYTCRIVDTKLHSVTRDKRHSVCDYIKQKNFKHSPERHRITVTATKIVS